jgi:hypothetical protein
MGCGVVVIDSRGSPTNLHTNHDASDAQHQWMLPICIIFNSLNSLKFKKQAKPTKHQRGRMHTAASSVSTDTPLQLSATNLFKMLIRSTKQVRPPLSPSAMGRGMPCRCPPCDLGRPNSGPCFNFNLTSSKAVRASSTLSCEPA